MSATINLAVLHGVFASLWIGCVLTEALLERSLLKGNRDKHLVLAELHMKVDWLIELPAILMTVITGTWLWSSVLEPKGAQWLMLSAGLSAVGINLICIAIVYFRRDAARNASWQKFDILDHWQHKLGAIVLICQLIALSSSLIKA